MVLSVINQFGKFLADGLDVVETREGHIAVEISGRGAWVNGEDFHRCIVLLKFNRHHTHINGIMMGTSYIQYLFVFLPMGGSYFTKMLTGLDMDEVRTGNILTRFSEATYGLGMNMVGDIYMNFSFIGVFVLMFLLGYFVARVEFPTSKYALFAYMALFANSIYLVRADIFSWLTFFVFFLIFDWLMRIHIVTYAETVSD